ncbi:EamA family transporter, partial [Kineococcus glutinatus]|uniref:EamA family transporter n=1 Tax=Kineococcus glutinatus TaxID=1070872 RepID=UPI0031F1ADCF
MTAVLLALASALAYGVSDFLGGVLSRRLHFALVGCAAQVAAVACTAALLALPGTPAPRTGDLLWGAAAGVGSAVGSLALYRGLARGAMNVVAPLSAVGSAALPVLLGLALGERLPAAALVGVVLALPAIWLVSRSAGTGPAEAAGRGLGDGLLAGAGFALLFIGLERAGDGSGWWP